MLLNRSLPLVGLFFVWLLFGQGLLLKAQPAAVGDPLPRVVCSNGYEATIYAMDLAGPDGLAWGPDGLLYAAEESAGRVVQISATGVVTPLLTNLASPEGVAVSAAGTLYVVEDTAAGRLISRSSGGTVTVLATGLDAPEGVLIVPEHGRAYITESNLQLLPANPSLADLQARRAHVTAVDLTAPYTVTRLITTTPTISINFPTVEGSFESLAGLDYRDGLIYVSNELGGVEVVTTTMVTIPPFPPVEVQATFSSTVGILRFNPLAADPPSTFSIGVITPEGVRFGPTAAFPLLVAEEDISGAAQEDIGRISALAEDGTAVPFCTGLLGLEDVLILEDGSLFVSEDSSGYIIRLAPPAPPTAEATLYLPLVVAP